MMRSMFSGVSGLRTHQTKMDVIAHNISNVNTVGFKSSRVTFNDVFSQTVSGASRANENTGKGGTNPMQIGLGVNVATIDKNMGTGAAQRTDRAMDVMINGSGFFIVSDGSGTYFTRAGAFELDEQGYLVMGNGMRVNGWDTMKNSDGETVIQPDIVKPIQIGPGKAVADPSSSEHIKISGNLNADAIQNSASKKHVSTMSFYDSIGNRWVVENTYEYDPTLKEWTLTYGERAYLDGDKKMPKATTPGGEPGIEFKAVPTETKIKFDADGKLVLPAAGTPAADGVVGVDGKMKVEFEASFITPANIGDASGGMGSGKGHIQFDLNDLTQFGKATTDAKMDTVDGNTKGNLEGLSVGTDGIITGRYSNGDTKILGQIPVAEFKNPAGLEAVGNNLYVTTANSGAFDGRGIETGDMMGGVLEMSNVDLSGEFTEMITTQRGFQASSRLITTSDEMLQELVNLKR